MLFFSLILWTWHEVSFLGSWAFWGLAHKKGWFSNRRMDDGKSPPDALYRRGVIEVLGSHLLFPVMMALIYTPWLNQGGRFAGVPSLGELFGHLAVFYLFNETFFYWSHRLLHHKKLFRLIHRKHHEWRHVRGISAEHAHVVETLLNFIAFWGAPVLLGSHFVVLQVWLVIRIVETVHAHSGFTVDGPASRHAFHHRYPTQGCLGSFWGPWDRIMGTDKAWKKWQEAQSVE